MTSYQLDPETAARARLIEDERDAASPEEVEHARAIIAHAEALGFVREPSVSSAYELYLLPDAKDAALYLAMTPDERDPVGLFEETDPERCEACGAVQLCDCTVSLR